MGQKTLCDWATDPISPVLKGQTPSQNKLQVSEAGSILRVDFALSKSPHLHRAHLVTVCNQKMIALKITVDHLLVNTVKIILNSIYQYFPE